MTADQISDKSQVHLPTDNATHNSEACKPSPLYESYLDTAISLYFDPAKAAELKKFKQAFNCDIHSDEDARNRAQQALSTLHDPYTKVISPNEHISEQAGMQGKYLSPGFTTWMPNITNADQPIKQNYFVGDVYENSPANHEHLKIGDLIEKINGRETSGMTSNELEDTLEGKLGNQLNLVINGADGHRDVSLPLKEIDVPSVSDRDLGNGVAYIHIRDFASSHEPRELSDSIARHKEAKAFVFDLRNNPGGAFSNALDSLELVLDQGALVETKLKQASDPSTPSFLEERYELSKDELLMNGSHFMTRGYDNAIGNRKVVVLTNAATMSAAEIFAAALHETGGVPLIGTTTYGKGIGQLVGSNFSDGGSEHVTAEQWFTPKHKWVGNGDGRGPGLIPTVQVLKTDDKPNGSSNDPQLKAAVEFLSK